MSEGKSRRDFLNVASIAVGGALGAGTMAAPAAEAAGANPASMSKGAQIKALLRSDEPFDVPFIPDIVSARLCEMLGFPAVFAGGNWASAARYDGIPDTGLITITELIAFATEIAEAVNIPVFADGDDGGGSPNSVYRATRRLEQAGIAGVIYEDSMQVKNYVRGVGELISKQEMVDKIKAAKDAARDPDFVIIARTDALDCSHPFDEAIERGIAYAEAGADVLFISESKFEDQARIRGLVKTPLYCMPPYSATREQVKAARINFCFRHYENIGAGAIYQGLKELKTTGTMTNCGKLNLPADIEAQAKDTAAWIARGRKYNIVPKA